MLSALYSERALLILVCVMSGITLLLTLDDVFSAREPRPAGTQPSFSYIGSDIPRTWPIEMGKVHKPAENTIHYKLGANGQLASNELASLLPRGGGLLHLGEEKRPFSVSLFHQLRCLEILTRDGIAMIARSEAFSAANPNSTFEADQPSAVAQHCLGYIRQMILCRADTRLESSRRHTYPRITTASVTHVCNDWSRAFEEAEKNWEDWRKSEGFPVDEA